MENQATHPYNNGNCAATGNYTGTLLTGMINGDIDPYPRAIISKCWTYNHEHNLAPYDNLVGASNVYYAGYYSVGMEVSAQAESGCKPIPSAVN